MDNYKIIISNLTKLLSSLKKTEFTLLDIYAENDYLLGDLVTAFNESLQELMIVGKADIDFSGKKKNITEEEWETDTLKIAQKFTNAVVIFNKVTQSKEDFMNMLESLQNTFPIVFVISNETFENSEAWQVKSKGEVHTFLNRKIKSFKSFQVANFSRIRTIKVNTSNDVSEYRYERSPEVVDIVLEEPEKKAVTRKQPNEWNLSMFDNLPRPSVTPDLESKVFLQEFYSYLKELLSIVLPEGKQNMIKYLLNKKTLKEVWLRAFTHKLIKPDRSDNYEPLETVGDRALDYGFLSIYCFERFPYASDAELTYLKTSILKSEGLAPLGEAMNLIDWAILPSQLRTNMTIKEDLLESFLGALDVILNNASSSYGQVSNIINNILKKVFDNYDFNAELAGVNRNFVEQLIDQIKDYKPKSERTFVAKKPSNEISSETWQKILDYGNQLLQEEGIDTPLSIHGDKKDSGFIMISEKSRDGKQIRKIMINDYGSRVLKKRGINVKSGTIIGESKEATSRPAENTAWTKAREYLERKGITEEWRDKIKMQKTRDNLDRDTYIRALAKAKQANKDIVDITVTNPKTLKKDQFFTVVGIDKNNKQEILSTFVSDNRLRDNYQMALENYLDQ